MDTSLIVVRRINIQQAQTVDSQVNLVALAESAAHNFYWKYDESVANKCKILAGLKKAAIQAAFVFLAILVPATAPAAGVIPAIEAGSSSFLAMNGPKLTQFALNFASAFPTNVSPPSKVMLTNLLIASFVGSREHN